MGTKLRCKIIAFETDPKLLIKLSTLEKHFNMYPDESALHNEDAERTESLLESVKELNHKYEQHLTTMAEEPEFEQEVDEEQEYKRIRELLQLKGMDEEDEEEENVEAEQEEQEEAGEVIDVEEGEDD